MTAPQIFVYGAGGHGKVVAEILLAAGRQLTGFIDDDARLLHTQLLGRPVVGNSALLRARAERCKTWVALGVGNNESRSRLAQQCLSWGIDLMTAIHPTAAVSPSALLGPGTVVMPRAVVNADARLGQGVIVNSGAIVEHDAAIGDWAHISPAAALGGSARLGCFSHLGMGAVVLPGVSVGSNTVVGAGAVVVRDLPDGVVAVGIPARVRDRQPESTSAAVGEERRPVRWAH